MRHTIRCFVCVSMLLAFTPFAAMSSAANDQDAGKNPPRQNAAGLPARVDLRPEFKKLGFEPRHQGHRGTCSVFTVTAALEFAISKKLDKPTLLSVEYLNWAANQVIHHDSDGHFFHNLLKGYQDYGICREDLMPYRMDFDPAYQPSSESRENAKSLHEAAVKITWINPWGPKPGLTDEQMVKIKQTLVQGWPVGTGSGHSRLFVGYRDDPNQLGGGRFITKDSGAGAYARVTYEWTKNNVTDVFWIEPASPQPETKEAKTLSPQAGASDAQKPVQGQYFAKKEYQPAPLPKFETTKDKLPSPVYDENPVWVKMYWKSWELAFRNFREPAPGSGYVTQFIDAAFNENIFQWDTCFMTMFCNYAHPLVPGIGSLDNFYCKQYEDGEIPREISRATGICLSLWINAEKKPFYSVFGWNTPKMNTPIDYRGRKAPDAPSHFTLEALNHPIYSWAEMEHCRITGDKGRIALVYEPLKHYQQALNIYLRQGNGLYITDWASMDNSERNPLLFGGGCGVDISSEMAMFDRDLATMADMLGKKDEAMQFRKEADETSALINKLMWDPDKKFYFDLTVEGKRTPVKTVAGFWPLIAGVASPEQAEHLAAQLNNPQTFARKHRVPTLAADESMFNPTGEYWRGSVWAPTDTMVIRGLERYGHADLAREIAINHLTNIGQIFETTGTVWENYAADKIEPGKPAKGDFVGWTGIGPILYLLEYGIGLKPDAPQNELRWELHSTKRVGCERYRFNGHVVDLLATPDGPQWKFHIVSDGDFALQISVSGAEKTFAVKKDDNDFEIKTAP